MGYLVVFLCLFNIVCWIVFLIKFKKLFTTDNVIESAKSQCDRIIADLNKNADRCITVMKDTMHRMQVQTNEADRKIKVLMDIERQGIGVSELQEKISTGMGARNSGTLRKALDAYGKNKDSDYSSSAVSGRIKSDNRISLTESGKKEVERTGQATLFDEHSSIINTNTKVNISQDGASYAEIPVVTPDVFVPEEPVVFTKKDLKSKIISMFDSGLNVEQIAESLACSTTEVQFALTLESRL